MNVLPKKPDNTRITSKLKIPTPGRSPSVKSLYIKSVFGKSESKKVNVFTRISIVNANGAINKTP